MIQMPLLSADHIDRWAFAPLAPMGYRVIMADPPWAFKNWSVKGEDRNATRHYGCMSLDAIKALPVGMLAADDAALFLWTIGPFTDEAFQVMRAWGFAFKGLAFCWAKPTRGGWIDPQSPIGHDRNWCMGLGYGTRSNVECCWLGTIGSPERLDNGVRELIVSPRREHSRKPDAAYVRARRLFGGPCVELFSREKRSGWDVWGNETEKFTNDEMAGTGAKTGAKTGG